MRRSLNFYLLLILFLFVFVFQFINFANKSKYDFFVFGPIVSPMNIILDTKIKDVDNSIIFKIDKQYYVQNDKKNIINKTILNEISSLEILVNKKFQNNVNDILVFNGYRVFYFDNFKKLYKSTYKNCINSSCDEYNVYSLGDKIKTNKDSDFLNQRNKLNAFCCLLLSLFFSNPNLIFSYILLIFLIFYFINNKNEIKFPKINSYIIIFLVFFLGIILRANNLFSFLPYGDEFATIDYSTLNLIKTISDPGNPPVFYLLYYFYLKLFDLSIYTLRIFPFILSLLSFYSLFWVVKKEFNLKISIIAIMLYSINIPLIHYSHELRSYILQTVFSVFLVYFLFKIIRKNKPKDYIFYTLFGVLAINTHYYEFLFLFFNFIFGIFYLINNKKQCKNFIISNGIIILSFAPYFLFCALNKALFNTKFNDWIPQLSFDVVYKCIKLTFGGFISLVLSIIFFIKINLIKNFNLKKKLYINYCFLSIFFIFFSAIIISIFRPMLVDRYLVLLIPLFIIFLSLVYSYNYRNKKIIILFLIWIFFIQIGTYVKNLEKKSEVELLFNFANQYVAKNKNSRQIYIILHCFDKKNLFVKKYIKIDDKINIVSSAKTELSSKINKIFKDDENAIILTFMGNENKEIIENYNSSCFFNRTIDLCLFKIEK